MTRSSTPFANSLFDPKFAGLWMMPHLMMMRGYTAWLEEVSGKTVCDRAARNLVSAQTDMALETLSAMQTAWLRQTQDFLNRAAAQSQTTVTFKPPRVSMKPAARKTPRRTKRG